jgi:hypothetical protein
LADQPRKQLITKLIFFSTLYPTYNAPKMMASRFPYLSRLSNIPSMLPFLVGCCVLVCQLAANKCHHVLYFHNFFLASLDVPNNGTVFPHMLHPPRATSPDSLPPPMLTLGLLLCFPFMFWPLKAKGMLIALFLMGSVSVFQTKELAVAPPNQTLGTKHGTIGGRDTMHCGPRYPTHGGRGQHHW